MSEEQTAPVVKTVEVEGLGEVPARFANQEMLAAYAEDLTDEQFLILADTLRSRKWSREEFENRVQILRPHVDILSKPEPAEEDETVDED